MLIGVPKEIQDNERRVSLTPEGAESLVDAGHKVLIQSGAGQGSGFADDQYRDAGADVLPAAADVYSQAEMILKVKEPQPSEYAFLRPGLLLFTYLHLAASQQLTQTLLDKQVTGIAYETVQLPDRSLPLLTPMSEVAGRMVVQIGAHYLEQTQGGQGVLLGGVTGVRPANVVIIGGGTVGTNAAQIALGMGAHVTVIDLNIDRLRYLDQVLGGRLSTLASNRRNIAEAARKAELLIGAVLLPGAKAPRLVTEEMIATMTPGSVVVDVAVDQGGCIETIHPTTHSAPTYTVHGVVHYAVPNIPGVVPRTSTYALSNATLPYVLKLANMGFRQAIESDAALRLGVNTYAGHVTCKAVAAAFGMEHTPPEQLF
ncbi:MAG: alanine dehydrogenase [Chloroflexi bacterium]|jgi:alanine dehydrogenase|nr:alanine dehydrogenase [Chloroflexota bacterium]